MFITFNATTEVLVATIGGKLNQPSRIGMVKWTCKDDGGALHTEQLDNTLYFPKSPINIMSDTKLAKQFNDEEGTGMDTKMNHSHFYWKNNHFPRKIHHSSSNPPELAINEGTTLFTWFTEIPSTPPVAAIIKIWKLIANQPLTVSQQLRKTHS